MPLRLVLPAIFRPRLTCLLSAALCVLGSGGSALAGSFSIEADPPPAAPTVAAMAPPAFDSGPEVIGFANGLPVERVVRQIVPRSLAVHFAPGVDTRQRANWRGGRGWRQVLTDALAPLGLSFDVAADGVTVANGAAATAGSGAPSAADSVRLAGWQVRGAMAGRAWVVGPDTIGGRPEEVVEGQDYSTLGRITGIFTRGSDWVVQTSRGWFSSQKD